MYLGEAEIVLQRKKRNSIKITQNILVVTTMKAVINFHMVVCSLQSISTHIILFESYSELVG